MIRRGRPAAELFAKASESRRAFARDVEKVPHAELEGYGGPRELHSRYIYGEDYLGVTSTNLLLQPARPASDEDLKDEKPFWRTIARLPARTEVADRALRLALDQLGFLSAADYKVLIIDRHHRTLRGDHVKVASTQLNQVRPGDPKSPYLVRTWNAPKSEIATLASDVNERIDLVLANPTAADCEEQLRTAMYAFFNCMPKYRGSAAIGRIVFSALYSHVNERKTCVPASIDVSAIIGSQTQFFREIEGQF